MKSIRENVSHGDDCHDNKSEELLPIVNMENSYASCNKSDDDHSGGEEATKGS